MKLRSHKTPTNRFKEVRAIHPNVGVEAWYKAQLDAMINAMASSVSAGVTIAYRRAALSFDGLVHYPEFGGDASPSLFLKRTLERWSEVWVSKFDKMSDRLSEQFADRAFRTAQRSMQVAFKQAGFTVAFKPTTASVEAYRMVINENVNLIRSIPAQYLKAVESQVWQSAMKGGDLHDLSVNLKKTYGVTAKRAALIARDQNAKAKAVIEATRRQELGITHAIWQHSAGGKEPRPTHVANDGKRYNIKTGWYDPDANGKGQGEYVWPGTLINCRCTSRAVIPAFDD